MSACQRPHTPAPDHSTDTCCSPPARDAAHPHHDGHEHRHSHDSAHEHEHDHAAHGAAASSCCSGSACCTPAAAPALITLAEPETSPDGVRTPIRIMQMDCPTEEGLLRKKLGGMPGVSALDFNLMQRVLTVTHDADRLDAVLAAIRELGFTPETAATGPVADAAARPKWPLALSALAAIASEASHFAGLAGWIPALLALVAIIACGSTTWRKGWVALRNGNLNINALMSIAVTGALLIGQWPEAAMVMLLFTVAELIEARSLDRARNAIAGLMRLAPETATVLQADGNWREQPAASVPTGSTVRVKPGERIALDGEITRGHSSVNQAPITGESLPVEKQPGDTVFAGTINETGSFEFRSTAAATESTLARIIHAVESAQGARAPTQRFVDQFARLYTPAVFLIALCVAVLPPLLGGGEWLPWIYKALVMLVIACPCALVISTPVTLVSGLAAAARQGILIKGGAFLEAGRRLRWIALDKTGTLTHGKPEQTSFLPLGTDAPALLRSLAAGLAARSDHPVSRALSAAAKNDGILPAELDSFEALPGRGSRGRIGHTQLQLGNHRLVHELGLCDEALEARIRALEQQGASVIALVRDQKVEALFSVADSLRPESREAVAQLHAMGIRTLILSGDNQAVVDAIAKQTGIDEARGECLPADKLDAIETRLGPSGAVGMVGDGINDAPALARADIGFAMGAAGSATALETADVALMNDDLRKLPAFVRLSRRTHSLLVQNIALALGIKAVFLALTLAGAGSMWMAVFADVGASLLVVGNGLRLLRKESSTGRG